MTVAGAEALLSDLVSCGSNPQTVHAFRSPPHAQDGGRYGGHMVVITYMASFRCGVRFPGPHTGGKADLWLQLPAQTGHIA
jgi:hypothetical protein